MNGLSKHGREIEFYLSMTWGHWTVLGSEGIKFY